MKIRKRSPIIATVQANKEHGLEISSGEQIIAFQLNKEKKANHKLSHLETTTFKCYIQKLVTVPLLKIFPSELRNNKTSDISETSETISSR